MHKIPLLPKFLALSLGLTVAGVAPSAQAASDTWTGASSGTWSDALNWSGGSVPGSGNTATFNSAGNGNTTIDLGAGVTLGALTFDTSSAAAYTIGAGAVGSQTLTLATTGGAMTMTSTVASSQLVNANLALGTTGTYVFTNDSVTNTLTIAGGISASSTGVKVLNVTGAGNTAISGAITGGSGDMNILKLGTGTLTLSGGGAFGAVGIGLPYRGSGTGAIFSGVLLGGTTKITGGTYTSTGEFVVGGVLANGGAGVNTNLTMDAGALTVNNYLSLGRGNGTGSVSSDIVLNNTAAITASNFSAGFNGGNAGNLPKASFILNGSSSFTVPSTGAFTLGESAGSSMTMTLNDSSTVTLGTGVTAIGNQNGTGILNINPGTTFTNGGEIRVAYSGANGTFSGSGTLNVNGGTLNTASLTVARNNNDVASTLNATVNLTSGTINVKTGTSLIGWRGTSSTGTLNISGGSFNQGSTSAANMNIGSFTGVTGVVNVSGGDLNLDNNSSLTFSNVNAVSTSGTLTISGGAVNFYSDAGSTSGGTGVIDLKVNTGTGTSTLNLNGGTLTANQIKATNATGTRLVNFNGGTLKAAGGSFASTFFANGVASTANVRDGGAIIDSNGFNVTVGQTLAHSAIAGDNATDGGLAKNGAGTLTLSAVNTYTGDTTVNAGTLGLADNAGLKFVIGATGVNNKIRGNGTVTLDGDFTFDLSGAGASPGDSWMIVDVTNLTETFGSTFTVTGFTDNGDNTWSSGNYKFSESTGILLVVPEPSAGLMLLSGVGMLGMLRRRRSL